MLIGHIASLTRYPVKSTGGEPLARATVERRGVHGDRAWAAYTGDGGIGSGKTTRRFRRVDGLLHLTSRLAPDGPVVTFPDGRTTSGLGPEVDALLSAHVGQRVSLRPETTIPHHDEAPLHVVTTASLRRLAELSGRPVDARRARANVVLDVDGDGFVEDAWKGRRLRLGESLVIALGPGMQRCVMVDAEQPGLAHGGGLLRTLGRMHGTELGLQANVVETGEVAVGDAVVLM